MPVNEEPIEVVVEVPIASRIASRGRDVMGVSERMPLRVIVLFIIAVACATLAQVPFNIVGVTAIVLLALDTATRRR